MVEILKDNGYYMIYCGKVYFGVVNILGESFYYMGFEVNIVGYVGGGLVSYLGENNYGNWMDGKLNFWFVVLGLEKYWGIDIFVSEVLMFEVIKVFDYVKEYN